MRNSNDGKKSKTKYGTVTMNNGNYIKIAEQIHTGFTLPTVSELGRS